MEAVCCHTHSKLHNGPRLPYLPCTERKAHSRQLVGTVCPSNAEMRADEPLTNCEIPTATVRSTERGVHGKLNEVSKPDWSRELVNSKEYDIDEFLIVLRAHEPTPICWHAVLVWLDHQDKSGRRVHYFHQLLVALGLPIARPSTNAAEWSTCANDVASIVPAITDALVNCSMTNDEKIKAMETLLKILKIVKRSKYQLFEQEIRKPWLPYG